MQLFRPIAENGFILGAVGVLQFDVVAVRLKDEYGVDAVYESVNYSTARWISCEDQKDSGRLCGCQSRLLSRMIWMET
ncbi:MAG: hypothetical protein ACOX5R_19675 [bacterium]